MKAVAVNMRMEWMRQGKGADGMIEVARATSEHVAGICRVCADGWRATYADMYSPKYIERIIAEYYNEERVLKEVTDTGREWGGYFVAVEDGKVVGAGGGGMIGERSGEVFVLYVAPDRRNEGIGTRLLDAITQQQKAFGATEQWVSVSKGNRKGIPFYEARGFVFRHEQPAHGNQYGDGYVAVRYRRFI